MVNKNKEVFEVLALVPNNGLNGSEKLFMISTLAMVTGIRLFSDQVKKSEISV